MRFESGGVPGRSRAVQGIELRPRAWPIHKHYRPDPDWRGRLPVARRRDRLVRVRPTFARAPGVLTISIHEGLRGVSDAQALDRPVESKAAVDGSPQSCDKAT